MSINPQTIAHIAARAGRSEQSDKHFEANVEMFNLRLAHEAQLAAMMRATERRNCIASMAVAFADRGWAVAESVAKALELMGAADDAVEAERLGRVAKAAHDKPCETCGGKDQSSHARDCSVMAGLLAEAAK